MLEYTACLALARFAANLRYKKANINYNSFILGSPVCQIVVKPASRLSAHIQNKGHKPFRTYFNYFTKIVHIECLNPQYAIVKPNQLSAKHQQAKNRVIDQIKKAFLAKTEKAKF